MLGMPSQKLVRSVALQCVFLFVSQRFDLACDPDKVIILMTLAVDVD